MADQFGGLTLPTVSPNSGDAVGDPTLSLLSNYVSAVINNDCVTAWGAIAPGNNSPNPVRRIFFHNPLEDGFSEADLPALYAYRGEGTGEEHYAEDYLYERGTILLLWVWPTAVQVTRVSRQPFANAIRKAVERAVYLERHPAFAATGDADPTATTLAALPQVIKLPVATSASPQSYSGGALDGLTGAAAVLPPRAVTATLGGSAGAFTPGSTITVNFINVVGAADSAVFTLPNPVVAPATFTAGFAAKQITSVAVAAQASTAGTISVGLGAYAGLGTEIFDFAPMMELGVTKARVADLRIQKGPDSANYHMLELTLTFAERLVRDLGPTIQGANTTYQNSSGNVTDRSQWPDNAID